MLIVIKKTSRLMFKSKSDLNRYKNHPVNELLYIVIYINYVL